MTLVAYVLTSQFSDWIEQLERIVLIESFAFLFLNYVTESRSSWAPGTKSIGSLQMNANESLKGLVIINLCRMGEGGGVRWRTLRVDHKILRGNRRRISRCQQRIWGGGGVGN